MHTTTMGTLRFCRTRRTRRARGGMRQGRRWRASRRGEWRPAAGNGRSGRCAARAARAGHSRRPFEGLDRRRSRVGGRAWPLRQDRRVREGPARHPGPFGSTSWPWRDAKPSRVAAVVTTLRSAMASGAKVKTEAARRHDAERAARLRDQLPGLHDRRVDRER